MLLLSWLLGIVLFTPGSEANEKAKMVETAIKALEAATAESDDVFMDLDSLGTRAASLMRAVIPIGAMTREAVNAKPKSEVYKALIDFKNRTDTIWKKMKTRPVITWKAFSDESTSEEYSESVLFPIETLKIYNAKLLDPTYLKDDIFFETYRKIVESEKHSPGSILMRLRNFLLGPCTGGITPAEAQLMSDARERFILILHRLKVHAEPVPELSLHLIEFMALDALIYNTDMWYENLELYNRQFSDYEDAVRALFKEMRYRATTEAKNQHANCPLSTLLYKLNYNYPTVRAFVSELKNQLLYLIFTASIKYHVAGGLVGNIDYFVDGNVAEYSQMSSRTSKWLNESLASAWPSAHNGILREHILRNVSKPGYVDGKSLKIVSDLTNELLINTGLPHHVYETLIVRSVDNNYELFFDGMKDHCSLNKGVYGFDTIVVRRYVNSANQQEKADSDRRVLQMRNDAEIMNFTIKREMGEIYNAATLPLIAKTLKMKLAKDFISEEAFHCWAIVRESSFYRCPTIDYWSSFNCSDTSITTLSYKKKGRFYQRCQEFRFFLFE